MAEVIKGNDTFHSRNGRKTQRQRSLADGQEPCVATANNYRK